MMFQFYVRRHRMMSLNSDLVGIRLKPYETTVTMRQTTNHAACINDNNPLYFDDTSKDRLVSHPMFPVAVTWPVLSSLDRFIDTDDFPTEVLLTQVHYSEHLVLHRLAKPDDALTIKGQLKAFIPHRAGTHAIIELEAFDTAGKPVFTEYIGAMLRGVDCGKGGTANSVPALPESRKKDGTAVWTSDVHIDPLMPFLYDGCTDIEFPIHTSVQFARAVGLPGIILQGTATLALAVREVVNREAGADPSRVSRIACNFTGMVMPGCDIRILCTDRVAHQNHTDIFFTVLNNENQKAIRNGYVQIKRGDHD